MGVSETSSSGMSSFWNVYDYLLEEEKTVVQKLPSQLYLAGMVLADRACVSIIDL